MITRAFSANGLFDRNSYEIGSNQSMITDKVITQKLQQNTGADLEPQTQTTSFISNPSINITEATQSLLPAEVTEIPFQPSFVLTPGFKLPLQIPAKIIRKYGDIHIDANKSEKVAFQDKFFNATSHQFRFQNNATSQF